jgi:hypothetical protein
MKVQLVHTRRRDAFVRDPGAQPASFDDPVEERSGEFVWSVTRYDNPPVRPPRWFGGRWSWKRGTGGRRQR